MADEAGTIAATAGWRREVLTLLDGDHRGVGHAVHLFIAALILLSVLAIGIETLPNLPAWAGEALAAFEVFVVVVFTIEYLLRLAATPRPLAYAFSFMGIVDLASILPFYLSLGVDLRAFRALRLFRLFRLFKLVRFNHAMDRFSEAGRMVREEIVVFLIAAGTILYLCALGIYYFEHEAQPEAFASVFQAMWWAAVTLTTVGYGDVYPITTGGRIFTILILFVGIAAIAVPTGIVTSALSKLRGHAEEDSGPKGDGPA